MKKKTFKQRVFCNNCSKWFITKLARGTVVTGAVVECSNCGVVGDLEAK